MSLKALSCALTRLLRPTAVAASILAGLLSACASQPQLTETAQIPPPAPPLREQVPDRPFDTETLYALLVAEFAGDRDRFDVMLNNYVQQARATRDPGVTARASRIARFTQANEDALAMSQQWAELEPNSLEAHFNAVIALTESNQLMKALEHAEILLHYGETNGLDAIAARALLINDPGLTESLTVEYRALSETYSEDPALLVGLSLLLQKSEDLPGALAYAQKAQQADPESFQAQAQEVRVLEQMGREDEALNKLGRLVEEYPGNSRLRLQYARALVKTDVAAAESEFLTLLAANPEDPDLNLTVGLVQYELGKYEQAKGHLLLLTEGTRHSSTAHAYLGRIAQEQGDRNGAIRHFQQVGSGSDYLPVLSELSDIYMEQDQPEAALTHLSQELKQTDSRTEQEAEGIVLLQSQVYNHMGRTDEAIAVLGEGLEAQPGSVRLLYARAMLYSEQDDIAASEQDFKAVLARAPNNAAVLNALGYTLADRTDRLSEAYEYISRAYELAPDDPAIIDSMGWVEYLRGNYDLAETKLRKAMSLMPDHEIAAHLGEVLWVTGKKEEARQVWARGLEQYPDSPIIQRTLLRLEVGEL